MALLDMFKKGAKRAGENLESYIGGLLGEDVSKLSENERKQLRRQGMAAVFDAMGRGTTATEGLQNVAAGLGKRLDAQRAQQRAQEAQQEVGRISGRLFGGAPAPTVQEGGENELTGVNVRSQYRANPQEALQRMYSTPAGMDVAQMAPGLLKAAEAAAGPKDYVYQNVAGVGLVAVNRKDPTDTRIVQREVARGGAGGGAAAGRFEILSGKKAEDLGFPPGTVVERNKANGQIRVLSSVPAAERTATAGREKSVTRVDQVANRITGQLDKVSTGGPLGAFGALSRVFDSQDAKLFESYRQQLSGAIRSALRIPGEGALSDFEQRQYGLQLPELGLSKENNLQIIESLKEQVRAAAGVGGAPASPAGGPPAGIPAAEWAAMTPAERALFR